MHVGLIIFLIFSPKIFPAHVPTQKEIELARKQLSIYSPPDDSRAAQAGSEDSHQLPKLLNRVAPPVEKPQIPSPVLLRRRKAADGSAGCAEAANSAHSALQLPRSQRSLRLRSSSRCSRRDRRIRTILNLQLPDSSPGKQIAGSAERRDSPQPSRGDIY